MKIEHIRYLRENHELKQKEIASILGISRQLYTQWETGDIIIPLKHLNNLSNYYNINMDYILGLSNIKTKIKEVDQLNKKEIGERLKTIRKESNLTLRDLAKELNTTYSTIGAYERGETLILTAFAYELCKNHKISLDWLCGKSNKKILK